MLKYKKVLALLVAVLAWNVPISAKAKKAQKTQVPAVEVTGSAPVVLWRNPTDIATRDLFFGPGGKKHEPHGPFTFVEEDMDGTNPKFVVHDEDGVKWKVKMGNEARPETVASRLVWAAGYTANEDYFVGELHVEGMPAHLRRGQNLVKAGTVHNVRLKRHLKGEEKAGEWHWRDNPFRGNRELNGLRVMMALINNWDLKDENNAIYRQKKPAKEAAKDGGAKDGDGKDGAGKDGDGTADGAADRAGESGPEMIYVISDLGASFGPNGIRRTHALSKDNFEAYKRSKFITGKTDEYVDFGTPGRPTFLEIFNPHEYFMRSGLRWIGHRIPRADARWMGQVLAQLSPSQIREAFRAAGYSPQEIEGFATVVQDRIAQLNRL
jgi:hypothetical protein